MCESTAMRRSTIADRHSAAATATKMAASAVGLAAYVAGCWLNQNRVPTYTAQLSNMKICSGMLASERLKGR